MTDNKAAVFILLGQSNAVGDSSFMKDEDKILVPMKNVFGLNRNYNQSFSTKDLQWSGYTSHGMNLAEEQDHTYSLANCLAHLWQQAINSGTPLPNLYIIQIAIGAQGVTDGYMWNPLYPKTLIPGKLGKVNISLYPFTQHIFSLVSQSLTNLGITDAKFSLHWRGGENDTTAEADYLTQNLKNIYESLFSMFQTALGQKIPITVHKHLCFDRCTVMFDKSMWNTKRAKLRYLNQVYEELCLENKNIEICDASNAPHYNPDIRGNGIFMEDLIHYNPETNFWAAQEILNSFEKDFSE